MDKSFLEKTIKEYVLNSPLNFVKKEAALKPGLEGMQIFDEPLVGYTTTDDPYFKEAKKPEVIGPHFMAPEEWLPGAKTVISIFFPFTSRIREENRRDMSWPAEEWLHGRIDGQALQNSFCHFITELFRKENIAAITPMTDPRFSSKSPFSSDRNEESFYTSNWSERHTAYACGLGTFGLSKGLITRKGVAGRFSSIITRALFEGDKRPYKGIYDYCTGCGACIRNCPAKAISKEKGKLHRPCSDLINAIKEKHAPYYGCGKCQVQVPCENRAPAL